MQLTIKSPFLRRLVTFNRPYPGYIFVDLNGRLDLLGLKLCRNGSVGNGYTICYMGDDDSEFERICRRWYREYTSHIQVRDIVYGTGSPAL